MVIFFVALGRVVCSRVLDLVSQSIEFMLMLRFISVSFFPIQTRTANNARPWRANRLPVRNVIIMRIDKCAVVFHSTAQTIVFVIDYLWLIVTHLAEKQRYVREFPGLFQPVFASNVHCNGLEESVQRDREGHGCSSAMNDGIASTKILEAILRCSDVFLGLWGIVGVRDIYSTRGISSGVSDTWREAEREWLEENRFLSERNSLPLDVIRKQRRKREECLARRKENRREMFSVNTCVWECWIERQKENNGMTCWEMMFSTTR